MRLFLPLFFILVLAGCTSPKQERYEQTLSAIRAAEDAGEISTAEALSLRIQADQARSQSSAAGAAAWQAGVQSQQMINNAAGVGR